MSSLQKVNDEEKAEILTISSLNSIKIIPHNDRYIAISPDGTQIVTLNLDTFQLNLCKSDNLSELHKVSCVSFERAEHIDSATWSLAVSNEITLNDGTVDVLIAVSCFDDGFVNHP